MANPLRRLLDPSDWLAVKPQLDPKALTLSLEHKADPGEVNLRIGVGLFVIAVVSLVVYFVADGFARFVACGFGLFGLLNLTYGVIQSGFEMSLAVTPDEVKVRKKSLFGSQSWSEPLSRYRGVMLRESQIRDQGVGNLESTKTYYIIELVHDEPGKTVPLHVSSGAGSPRALQEEFARRLRLPALSEDSSRDSIREIGDLDQPLRSREPARDPGPPPSGVVVERSGDETRISVGMGRFGHRMAFLFWLAIPLTFGFIGYQVEPMFGLVGGGMAALFVGMMFGLGRLMGGENKSSAVCFSSERVWIDRPARSRPVLVDAARTAVQEFAGVEFPEVRPILESIPLGAVEQIRVDTYVSHRNKEGPISHPRLLIEADAGRLEFMSSQFDRKKLEWVRDFLEYEWSRPE